MTVSLSYSQDSLINKDTSYFVSSKRIKIAVIKMIRANQLAVELDSVLLINNNLKDLNGEYLALVNIHKEGEENLQHQIYNYKDIIEKDSLNLIKEKKDNKKKRIKQGIVTVSIGIIIGLLASLF